MRQCKEALAVALLPRSTFWWGGINRLDRGHALDTGNEGWKSNDTHTLRKKTPKNCSVLLQYNLKHVIIGRFP